MNDEENAVEYEALTRDIIALVRSAGPNGESTADTLQMVYDTDGAPLLGAINAMEDVRVLAPPDFERRLRALNEDHDLDDEYDELVESQERLRKAA